MKNNVEFSRNGSSDTTRDLSPAIWNRFFKSGVIANPNLGTFRHEKWESLPLVGTQTTQIGYGNGYKVFASSGSAVVPVSAVNSVELQGGVLALTTDTDNDASIIADAYPRYRMSGSTSTDGLLCFEACIAQKSVATNMAATFIGLGETDLMTLAVALPFNAGNPITNDGSMIGFRIEEDGLGVVDTVYSDRATSFTNIGDTEGGTLVAYTFKKFGFVYDPKDSSNCVTFFADNVALTSRLTKTALQALTNLDANALGFLYGTVADSAGTAHESYCKWMAIGQLYP